MTAVLIGLTIPGFSDRGNCVGVGDAMYPKKTDDAAIDYARQVCAACPVTQECRDWAVTNNETHGIWGGTTPNERETIRRRERREKSALTQRGQHRLALYQAGQTDAQIAKAQNVPTHTIRLWRNHHQLTANEGPES